MLNAVDWTGLFILGGVIVGSFLLGLKFGLGIGDLRERVTKLESKHGAEEDT